MEFKILSRKEYPLLKRERINLELTFLNQPTPKNDDIKKSLSSFLKAEETLMAVQHVYTKFGESKAKIILNLYKDIDTFNLFEKKKEKKAAAPAAK